MAPGSPKVSLQSSAKIKAAVVHASPVYMDKQATTAKVLRLIEEAGEKDVQLLAFPETFVPGYPVGSRFLPRPSSSGRPAYAP